MSLIKDEDEDRRDYILQKDKTTKRTAGFVAAMLILLTAAVIISGLVFKWF